jgi:inhibitor of cysteine peptidase
MQMELPMKKLLVLLCITALATSSCAGTADPQAENLVISDPAKNLETAAGSEFKIVLDSNPSTGYHWELGDDLDESIVQFVSNNYNPPTSVVPGSGGQDVWIFKAMKEGQTYITLLYYPPSNEPVEPQQKVTFTVTVK